MALSAGIFVLQWLSYNIDALASITDVLLYAPLYSKPAQFEPWRMLTSVFAHSPTFIMHILLNMYTLWLFGRQLESFLGSARFVALYLLSGLGGSVAVLLWVYVEPMSLVVPVVGASGAIFGLLGAFLVIGRALGSNMTGLVVLLAINLVIGFLPGTSVAWQAHLGGLVVGAIVGLVFMRTRREADASRQKALLGAVAGALVLLSFSFFVVPPLF